jgi:hypothetical protein
MNIIIERFIKDVKSKPPGLWTIWELEDFAFSIRTLYTYADLMDRQELKPIYDKIAKFVNEKKVPTIINPGALLTIDKEKPTN